MGVEPVARKVRHPGLEISGLPQKLARPFLRAIRYCQNGDHELFQPATKAFARALRRYIASFESSRGSLLEGDFAEHLQYFTGKPLLKIIHPYVFDMFNLRYRDFLYAKIADLILESGKAVPQLEAVHDNPDCFAEIVRRPDACVVLALHTGFPHSARLLTSSGRSRVTSIVGGLESVKALYQVNHVPDFESIRMVQADRNTLVNLKASVKDGHAIVCAPDHINPATSKCDQISRAMFDFAARKGLQIYFLDYAVTERGQLKVFSERAAQGADVDHAIEQFCRFCFQSSGRRVMPITRLR